MPCSLGPVHRAIASGAGLGFLPRRLWGSDKGAGTVGAGLAAVVGLALLPLPVWVMIVAVVVATVLSLWSAAPFAAGGKDPGWVCIDEVAGTLLALIGLSGIPWVAAWVVARAADIWKVLPGVGAAERLPGAVGVTMDDLVAGGYGLAAGWLLTLVL